MKRTKRRRENSTFACNKRKKVQVKNVDLNESVKIPNLKTDFEDLANEIIYEIFEFLDFHHIYVGFSNLNKRFENLLINSIHSIKMSNSSMSKSTFEYYYTHMIKSDQDQIKSLDISNPFIINYIFKPHLFIRISNFIQLETLILNNLEKIHLKNILKQLILLPKLSSLTIICADILRNNNNYFRQIFRLPVLKYCKVKLNTRSHFKMLPFCHDNLSSIEHLLIENKIYLLNLIPLLSHVRQLRRLSISHLFKSVNWRFMTGSVELNHLIHLSIHKVNIGFDDLEYLIRNCFPRLEVLNISRNSAREYADANRWEQLIVLSMPHLKIFDIQFNFTEFNKSTLENIIKQFNSSFWLERQWFFGYNICESLSIFNVNFYSARKKHYILIGENNEKIPEKNQMDSVHHVDIRDEKVINDCKHYFPNATELTLNCKTMNKIENISFTVFNHILPLKQLTTLHINEHPEPFTVIVKLLSFALNIHTLILNSASISDNDLMLNQQCENFQLVSNTNNVKNMSINAECTFKQIEYLVKLCPRLQHLLFWKSKDHFRPTLLFLLTKKNTPHLYSICIQHVYKSDLNRINSLIKLNRLLNSYSINIMKRSHTGYLWW